ncbi:MAG: alpha/beta fold hydrolase [bacterium]|nr:alpha/beta fold hydrolase [bacterium]
MKLPSYQKASWLIIVLIFFLNTGWATQKFCQLGDFQLENGEMIRDCQIGYRTFGKLNQHRTNAILYPTWFCGTSEHIGKLIGTDKLVDSTNFFIIAVDALANGISSSPSNSAQQLGELFPEISIRDMVNSQHRLLTWELGINHLHGIIGGSMGSMQVFQWLVSYPDFMDKAIAYVGTPRPSSYDLLIFETYLQLIQAGKKFYQPDSVILKNVRLVESLFARSADHFVKHHPRESVPQFISTFDRLPLATLTVDNWACQSQAILNHDIFSEYNGSMTATATIVKAEVLIIVASTDHYVNPQPALEFGKHLNCETLILDSNCGHLSVGCELQSCATAISDFLNSTLPPNRRSSK